MRFRGVLALLCVLAVLGGGAYYARQRLRASAAPSQPVYATAPVSRGDLVADVLGFGPLNADFQNPLRAPAQGTVQQVFVHQGDTVHSGAVLAILSNPEVANQVQTDQVALQRDLAHLADALGVPTDQALKAAVDTTIPVHAPQGGRLEQLKPALGASVKAGDELAQIVDDGKVVMDLALVPYDAQRAAVGDPVDVHFDQFAGDVQGEITQISPNPVPASSPSDLGAPGGTGGSGGQGTPAWLVYPTVITLANPGLLKPGLSGQVTIHAANGAFVDPRPGTISGYGTSTVVNSPLDGTVTTLLVAQGAWVKQGDTLLTLGGPAAANSVAALEAQVASDQTTLQQDQQTQADLTMTSTLDGTVGFLNLQVGQRVNNGDYLGVVFNDASMNLSMQVDELQVANVHAGQAVQITTPGLPGKVFSGKVVSVDTMGQNQQGLATFNVRIEVTDTSSLKPGMTADARIAVDTAKNALLVPVEAVLQQGNQAVVEVLRDGKPAVVPVTVGLVNDQSAQITTGLTEGETVITGMAGQSLPGLSAVPGGKGSGSGSGQGGAKGTGPGSGQSGGSARGGTPVPAGKPAVAVAAAAPAGKG